MNEHHVLNTNPLTRLQRASTTPIGTAIRLNPLLQAVQMLIDTYPDGVRWTRDGCTLLHYAACNHATPQTVQVLLRAWPDAAKERDPEGNTPLHFAAACQATPSVVRLLIDAYPEATALKGRLQRYPFHLGLLCKTHPESLMLIKEAGPSALYSNLTVADHFNSGSGVCQRTAESSKCEYCHPTEKLQENKHNLWE